MQARYQYGDLRIRKRNKGPDVWQFRCFENGKRKSVLIGTVEKLPTKADAERAVEHRRIKVNAQIPQQQFHAVTMEALVERYKSEEMPSAIFDASFLPVLSEGPHQAEVGKHGDRVSPAAGRRSMVEVALTRAQNKGTHPKFDACPVPVRSAVGIY